MRLALLQLQNAAAFHDNREEELEAVETPPNSDSENEDQGDLLIFFKYCESQRSRVF